MQFMVLLVQRPAALRGPRLAFPQWRQI